MEKNEPIEKEIYIAASPEEVFGFLTDATKLMRWIGIETQIDAIPGGIFRVVPNRVDVIRGEFLTVLPHSKVAFTWGFEGEGRAVPAGSTVVEVTLRPEGEGTRLTLVHRDLTDAARDKHDFGWNHYLSRVKVVAEGGDAGPDPFADPTIQHGV